MSSRVFAVCDICGYEQEFKTGVPLNQTEWQRELEMEMWWQRPDFDAICPKHPQPVDSSEVKS